MSEPLMSRIARLVSASLGDAVERLERANGPALMREAIREVEHVAGEVRAAQDAATTRRLQAERHQAMIRGKLLDLEGKARFALAQDREALAEAAVSRGFDLEVEGNRLRQVQVEARAEAARLEAALEALLARKHGMAEALAAFEGARAAALGEDGPAWPKADAARRVDRAEGAFNRAMAGAGGVAGAAPADLAAAAGVAEIAVLQKGAVVARRLAALRDGLPGA